MEQIRGIDWLQRSLDRHDESKKLLLSQNAELLPKGHICLFNDKNQSKIKLINRCLMDTSNFEMPIDNALVSFVRHIKANPRTILSSKFGDGKSYFLDKLRNDDKVKEEFEFITIYPINYQVAENKDIFDLIKHDIICQLVLKRMIGNNVTITKFDSLKWFLFNNSADICMNILSYLPALGVENNYFPIIAKELKVTQLFKHLKAYINSFKEDTDYLEEFASQVEETTVYESDLITKIIQQSINAYKVENRRKVALLIEDMDRIDPAHLFRIMNVFSAHIDYGYRMVPSHSSSAVGNKFGFDNIVIALDFDNLKSIYHHFYGATTDFNGYISKFLSSNYYTYSLKDIEEQYVVNLVVSITSLTKPVVSAVVNRTLLESHTIREIVSSFEYCNEQIPVTPYGIFDGKRVALNTSFLRLIAILKRLKIRNDEIVNMINKIRDVDDNLFLSHVGAYMFEESLMKNGIRPSILVRHHSVSYPLIASFTINDKEGILTLTGKYVYDDIRASETDFNPYVRRMMELVA